MFNSNPNNVFVPSKIVSVKPEVQTEYTTRNNTQIRFHIPSYVGFADPQNIRLNANVQVTGRGSLHPDGNAGFWSLIRDMRISDGTGRTELEMLSDMNVLCAQEWGFSANDSVESKRELFSGMSKNADLNNQLYHKTPDDWTAGVVAKSPTPIQLKISAPIPCSGIIGEKATNVFPLTATSGLRVTMNVDNITRSCMLAADTGTARGAYPGLPGLDPPAGVGTVATQKQMYLTYDTKGTGAANNDVVDTTAGTGNDGIFTIAIGLHADIAANPLAPVPDPDFQPHSTVAAPKDMYIVPGDIMYITDVIGDTTRCLGVVKSLSVDANNRCEVTYEANRANGESLQTAAVLPAAGFPGLDAANGGSSVFFVASDRIDTQTLQNTNTARVQGSAEILEGNEVRITDLELSILQVEPPAGYVESMINKVNSSGVEMDYCTSTVYRGNITNAQGMTSNLIPANESRSYSIISVPLLMANQTNTVASSLVGSYDRELSYQWSMNGSIIPDRPIDLRKYGVDKNPVLHIMENEKAIENAKISCRNLWNTSQRLIFARALSRYGQVHDLQETTTMLRITYDNDSSTDNFLLNNNIVHLNRMIISADGVTVVR